MDTVTIRFPSISCCVCHDGIEPGTEAAIHPSLRGPKGGKKYAHLHCMGHAHSNPSSLAGIFGTAIDNAGRRKKRGRQYMAPSVPHPGPADWLGFTTAELVAMSRNDDHGAIIELHRRGRDEQGLRPEGTRTRKVATSGRQSEGNVHRGLTKNPKKPRAKTYTAGTTHGPLTDAFIRYLEDGQPVSTPKGRVTGSHTVLTDAFLRMAAHSTLKPGEDPATALIDLATYASNDPFDHYVRVTEQDSGELIARWDGVFTPGRTVTLQLLPDGKATLDWDTGTGRPSTHIGRALALARART
jgi:hypothetical protein